jgi:glycerate-2-kinase
MTAEQTEATIILSKGGTSQRTAPIEEIHVPDLWNLAQELNREGRKVYTLNAMVGEFQWVLMGDYILECWHLAHDLKRHIQGG